MSDFVAGECGRRFVNVGYLSQHWCGDADNVCPHCKRILELEKLGGALFAACDNSRAYERSDAVGDAMDKWHEEVEDES